MKVVGQLGLPTFVCLFFIGWFFLMYFPRHEQMTEDRIQSIVDTHNKFREDQTKIMQDQANIFKGAVKEMMLSIKQMEQSIRVLSEQVMDIKKDRK